MTGLIQGKLMEGCRSGMLSVLSSGSLKLEASDVSNGVICFCSSGGDVEEGAPS